MYQELVILAPFAALFLIFLALLRINRDIKVNKTSEQVTTTVKLRILKVTNQNNETWYNIERLWLNEFGEEAWVNPADVYGVSSILLKGIPTKFDTLEEAKDGLKLWNEIPNTEEEVYLQDYQKAT